MLPTITTIITNSNDDDDDGINHNEASPNPAESTHKPQRQHVEFYLDERLKLLSKIKKAGITLTDLRNVNDEEIRDKVNDVIDPILLSSFAPKYHITNPSSSIKREWRKKIRRWAKTQSLSCTKINHQTVGRKAKRNGGGGRKQVIDPQIEYKIYKCLNEECLKGRTFTFKELVDFISFYLRESGTYRIKEDPVNDDNEHLQSISINEYFIDKFKKKWNLSKRTQGTKTMYDYNQVLAEHAIVCAKVFTLRLLLGEYVTYTGHHDQVCLFYAHSRNTTYTSHITKGTNGQKKKQNKNKTFTGIPTCYHDLESDTISFGPTVLIFESAAKHNGFGKGFLTDLRKLKLDKYFDKSKTLYIDTSYNG